VRAAHEAELGGADGITIHLREDRRHINDRDAELLRRLVRVKFNLEMGATDEMVKIACRLKPHTSMLVPEGRMEVTTEGGLDIVSNLARVRETVAALKGAGIVISAFIDADARQIEAAAKLGIDVCEIHTGPYAHAFAAAGGDFKRRELVEALRQVRDAATYIVDAGMRCNAGHALNYANVGPIAQVVHLANLGARRAASDAAGLATASHELGGHGQGELHIGHAIVSRAVFVGLRTAVSEMKQAMASAVQSLSTLGGASSLDLDAPFGLPSSPGDDLPRGTRLA
jgi:pyridoxine 5-phosphate synthase